MSKAKKNSPDQRIPAEHSHLYGLQSPKVLAARLGWELGKLEALAAHASYRVFSLKESGRVVEEPPAHLQSLHRQIHRYLGRIEVPEYLHSAVKGRSYLSNARPHIGSGAVINLDIKKFFPSVPQHRVMHFFRDTMKCAGDTAGLLANLICRNGKLATGSAASPIISYYAFKGMFDELHALALSNGLIMTCYVDDITMSGSNASQWVLHEARKIILRNGLGAHKARFQHGTGPKLVTGTMVSATGLELPFSRWKKIRAQIGELNAAPSIEAKLAILPRLVSRLYEAAQLDMSCRRLAEFHHDQWRRLKANSLVNGTLVAA